MNPAILVLNGALAGDAGNTEALLARARATLAKNARVASLTLDETTSFSAVEPSLRSADGFLLGTGTYWDSWSHLLQRFLQEATASEGTALWLGKPAGVVVTMHSVGGKGVLSRLQGVLNTFGCTIPPMSGLVYSHVNQAALETETASAPDLWTPDDLNTVCHNVLAALSPQPRYRAWPVDRQNTHVRWIHD